MFVVFEKWLEDMKTVINKILLSLTTYITKPSIFDTRLLYVHWLPALSPSGDISKTFYHVIILSCSGNWWQAVIAGEIS